MQHVNNIYAMPLVCLYQTHILKKYVTKIHLNGKYYRSVMSIKYHVNMVELFTGETERGGVCHRMREKCYHRDTPPA